MRYNANSFVADELVTKVQYLNLALEQANEIIATLEQENDRIKDVITNLTSIKKDDLDKNSEVDNDRLCSV
jgi:hypothetical protein